MSIPKHPAVLSTTIKNGASLSTDAIDLGGYLAFALLMPAAWTAAVITLLACDTKDGNYKPVYDDSGNEVSLTVAADRVIAIDAAASKIAALRFIRLRSGTAAAAVNQAADRDIGILLKR